MMRRDTFLAATTAAIATGCAGNTSLLPNGSSEALSSADPRRVAGYYPAHPLPAQRIIGEVWRFDGKQAPNGWMICDGRSLPVHEYPHLYAVLGRSCGSASKGHFRIPQPKHFRFVVAITGVVPANPRVVAAAMAHRAP
jgi:hypothetical protein